MADHKHGEMDIAPHEKTFAGFVNWVSRAVVIILLFLIFLAMVNG